MSTQAISKFNEKFLNYAKVLQSIRNSLSQNTPARATWYGEDKKGPVSVKIGGLDR